MTASQPLCMLLDIDPKKLSKEKRLILEAEMFVRIYEKFQEKFGNELKNYLKLLKSNFYEEKSMFDEDFVQAFIQNMLSSGEYTLEGITNYTGVPEDFLMDMVFRRNA